MELILLELRILKFAKFTKKLPVSVAISSKGRYIPCFTLSGLNHNQNVHSKDICERDLYHSSENTTVLEIISFGPTCSWHNSTQQIIYFFPIKDKSHCSSINYKAESLGKKDNWRTDWMHQEKTAAISNYALWYADGSCNKVWVAVLNGLDCILCRMAQTFLQIATLDFLKTARESGAWLVRYCTSFYTNLVTMEHFTYTAYFSCKTILQKWRYLRYCTTTI